jgi:hypothetical protein
MNRLPARAPQIEIAVPQGTFALAHNRPPVTSAIERWIDN